MKATISEIIKSTWRVSKMDKATVSDCRVIELPQTRDRAGNITPVTGALEVPFEIARVFYIYDIPGGQSRGAHAHRVCHQLLVAVSGSFDVEIDDGEAQRTVTLNRPYYGLYVPAGIWAAQKGFSSGSVCLVIASERYDEADYIRDYDLYRELRCTTSK